MPSLILDEVDEQDEINYNNIAIEMLEVCNINYNWWMLSYKNYNILRPELIFYEIDNYLFVSYISVLLQIRCQ